MTTLKFNTQQTLSPSDNDPISLKEQFQMKSLIMAKWAHELKNIFLAISSLIQNQSESIYPENAESVKMSQISLQHSSKFLSSLCDFGMYLILDITTLNTNNETMKERQESIAEFNLSEALEFCIAMFQSKQKFDPRKKNLSIKSQYNFPLTKTIKSINENRFKQVIINLLSNSYKFTLNGEICLCCNYVSNDKLRVQICDTGIGMTPEEQEKLFKPYNIIEQNKEINSHGSGLGLYIVKEILTSFGTNIHLRSKKNSGTEFWFDLTEKESDPNHYPNDSLRDKNAIDPGTIITDSLKKMIRDINEGKKDDMIWEKAKANGVEVNNYAILNKEQEIIINDYIANSNDLNNKKNSNRVLTRLLSFNTKNLEEKKDHHSNRNLNSNMNNTNDKSYPSSSKYISKEVEDNYYPSLNNSNYNNAQDKQNRNECDKQSNTKVAFIKSDSKSNIKIFNDINQETIIEYGRSLSQFPQHLRSQQLFCKKTKKYNIFICDDEQITAISTKNLLLRYFKTETSYSIMPEMYIIPNGIECIYKAYQFLLEENPVNLILIDQNMPFINGIEVCNLIKNMTEMNNIKVYLVTSEDGEKTKKNTKADGYFSKPITKSNIKEILKKDKIY